MQRGCYSIDFFRGLRRQTIVTYPTVKLSTRFQLEVLQRSNQFGPVPPIQYGEIFRFRNQLMLAGLHNDLIRGICVNLMGYATCVVTKYPLHNFINEEGFSIIGGEGGGIAAGHIAGVRNDHQWLSQRSIGMRNSLLTGSLVRLVCHGPLNATQSRYTYQGQVNLLEEILLTPQRRIVHQYVVNPAPLQVLPPAHMLGAAAELPAAELPTQVDKTKRLGEGIKFNHLFFKLRTMDICLFGKTILLGVTLLTGVTLLLTENYRSRFTLFWFSITSYGGKYF